MSDEMSREDIERLQKLLAQANKSMRELERKYSKLVHTANEVIKWAEWDGARYTVGSLPVDELREALKRLRDGA